MEKKTPKVDAEKVARLLAIKPASYTDFTEDQARDFLATLYEAGEVEAVRKYYYTTIRRPYLFRSRADKDTIPADLAREYYYGAIILDVLEDVVRKCKNFFNINYFDDESLSVLIRDFNRARAFCVAAEEERKALGDVVFKEKVVPARDGEAASLYSVAGGINFLHYKPGEGVYKISAPDLIDCLFSSLQRAKENTRAYYIVSLSAGDALKAYNLEAYAEEFYEVTARTERAIKSLYAQYSGALHFLTMDKKEKPGLYTEDKANFAREKAVRHALDFLKEDFRKDKTYKYNLFVYGNGSAEVYDKVKALNDGKEKSK